MIGAADEASLHAVDKYRVDSHVILQFSDEGIKDLNGAGFRERSALDEPVVGLDGKIKLDIIDKCLFKCRMARFV